LLAPSLLVGALSALEPAPGERTGKDPGIGWKMLAGAIAVHLLVRTR